MGRVKTLQCQSIPSFTTQKRLDQPLFSHFDGLSLDPSRWLLLPKGIEAMGHLGCLSISTALGLDFAVLTNPPPFPAMVIFPQFVYCDSISACNREFSFFPLMSRTFSSAQATASFNRSNICIHRSPDFQQRSCLFKHHIIQRLFLPSFFFLFPVQCCMFKSLEASDLSRCYRVSWFSIHTASFLTALNSSLSLCKKKKIFNTHGQGQLQKKHINTPKQVTPGCVVSICLSFQFCWKNFIV